MQERTGGAVAGVREEGGGAGPREAGPRQRPAARAGEASGGGLPLVRAGRGQGGDARPEEGARRARGRRRLLAARLVHGGGVQVEEARRRWLAAGGRSGPAAGAGGEEEGESSEAGQRGTASIDAAAGYRGTKAGVACDLGLLGLGHARGSGWA